MIPTPRARALASTISRSLESLEHMLQHATEFDPQTAQRCFVIAMRESHELSLVAPLSAALAGGLAGIQFACVRSDRRDLEEDLRSGELDLALDIALPLPADVRRQRVRTAPMVVLARRGHPAVQGSLDLEGYLAQEHVLVTGRRHGFGYEDAVLERLGRSRRIRLRCQHHRAANELVSRSDLLVTMPRDYAQLVNSAVDNATFSFPVEAAPFESYLYWHANVDEDPANRWFRGWVGDAFGTPS
jgi:DNA-binding transcriptional LysR family regulator